MYITADSNSPYWAESHAEVISSGILMVPNSNTS